jgi:hypothetical protein
MERLTPDIWRQDYYSHDFFNLTDVQDDEEVRLSRLNVSVVDYDISIGTKDGALIFFLHLYFTPSPFREVTYEELFGNIN